jgi:hypothetical protein
MIRRATIDELLRLSEIALRFEDRVSALEIVPSQEIRIWQTRIWSSPVESIREVARWQEPFECKETGGC